MDQKTTRTTTPERRPVVAAKPQSNPATAASPAPARALQQRMGNQATQSLVSRTLPVVQPATNPTQPKSTVGAEQAAPSAKKGTTPDPTTAKSAPPGAPEKAPSGATTTNAPDGNAGSKTVGKPGAAGDRPSGKTGADAASARGAKGAASGAGGMRDRAKESVPSARDAIAPAIAAVHSRAAGAQKHAPAHTAVSSAQAAAISPPMEQQREAAAKTVTNLDATKAEKVRRDEFKAKLRKAIDDATPRPTTEDEANKVMDKGASQASGVLRGQLATERDTAAGALTSAAGTEVAPSSQPAQAATVMQSEPAGPPPTPVSAAPVVPAPLPPERLDYSADRGPTEQLMSENKVTPAQMQEGNDPAFGPTLQARSSAEQHESTAAATYRQGEGKVQDQAQAAATQALAKDLAGIHGMREQRLGSVVTQQLGTKTKDAQERQRITTTISAIKDKTRTDVGAILKSMEEGAGKIFEDGLKHAEKVYTDAFKDAKGGVGTWLTTWGSAWDKHINAALVTARNQYMNAVDKAIDDVSVFVDNKLTAAKQRVADGRREVDTFVAGLDASVKQFGEEALQAVSADFDTMGSEIDQRSDGLIGKLTEQYKASYERMSAMEDKLREENKSLWQRVYDATVGVIKQIIEFKNMLLGMLGRAASVIGDIIAHPIRFLGNLVAGVMQGLKNFMSKIGTYLLKGLMDWLFGALSGAGLQLPEKFDLQGIISIVLQVLGLTYANFRARAVTIMGEPVVAAIEKTAEVFKVLITEGVPGLWRFIKEQLANLKSMVMDAIFDYIKEKVIMAGITWIIGLLNPASAFFKACKAIYDIVMFFVTRGRQIMELVNAVIDSMAAIASGSIGVAATFVENALAKAIPVAIGFLAGLLGLGDPSKTVKGFIEKAQTPVNKAIDWVINLAVKAVKTAGKFIAQAGVPNDPQQRLQLASRASVAIASRLPRTGLTAPFIARAHDAIKLRYGLTELTPYQQDGAWHVRAVINPPLVWRLPLPIETAGTGGIHMVATQTGLGGEFTAGVRGELSPGIPRQGFEANLPLASNLPDLAFSYLRGYRRAHVYGPGFGDETAIGLMYASEQVNNELQSKGNKYGIEGYARQIRERVTALGGRVAVEVIATSFPDPPPGVPQALNQPVLRSVTYTFVVVDAHGNELRYRGPRATATITCNPPRPNGTGGQGKINYEQLIELNEYLGSRSQATGL